MLEAGMASETNEKRPDLVGLSSDAESAVHARKAQTTTENPAGRHKGNSHSRYYNYVYTGERYTFTHKGVVYDTLAMFRGNLAVLASGQVLGPKD